MKKKNFVLSLILSVVFISCSGASDATKARIEEVIAISKRGDCDKLAGYILYNGRNVDRHLKDTCSLADSAERERVYKGCSNFRKDLDSVQSITFNRFFTRKREKIIVYIWEVLLNKKEGPFKYYWEFLKVDSKYYIGAVR